MKLIVSVLTVAVTVVLAGFVLVALAKSPQGSTRPTSTTPAAQIERGRYLVHRVGMCIDCHSPRDASGSFIEAKQLAGSPLAFAPTVPMPWSPSAPRLAGLPAGFTQAETVHFLVTGERPHGRPAPLPPMPPYRFERADAAAIAAYLQSLPVPATE